MLRSPVLPASARVAGFTGRERLSELYRFSIGVLTAGEEIDVAAARGRAATFVTNHGADDPLEIHGMIAGGGLRHAWQGQALYELVLVPKVWALSLTHYCRVFVDKSVIDILHELFADSGLSSDDYELRLQADYPAHPHTCQYKESRWAFLNRLMERAGLYNFFEQGPDGEKLIITDHRSFHRPLRERPARYIPLSGGDDALSAEALSSFVSEQIIVPQSLTLRDFDYLRPTLDVKAEQDLRPVCAAARVHHGEHDFRSPEDGAPLAQIEAEAWQARELVCRGRGRLFGLRAGYRFSLDEHPLDSLNAEYLAVEVSHWGNQAADAAMVRELLSIPGHDDYAVEVHAIRATTPYRPERVTPIPRISGVERAVVDGPADDCAQIDEHGRYKVKLHFDIDDSEQCDGDASTWIRMLQPHGGTVEGFHFPLRKNIEVLVVFLGGDPDRPVITGAVPNATQPSPVLADNHTQNVLQTGGASRIEIEDLQGSKYFDLYTPPKDTWIHLGVPHAAHSHYIVVNTEGNQLVNIGGNRDIEVGGPQNEHVVGAVTETYDAYHQTTVAGHLRVDLGANEDRHIGGWWNTQADAGATLTTPQWTNDVSGHTLCKSGSAQLNFGPTDLYFGPTTAVWGDTTVDIASVSGKVGSLTLSIPGGATINASNWKINTPGYHNVYSEKHQIVGLYLSAVAVKLEVVGFKVANKGATLSAYGSKTDKCGSKNETAANESKQGGILAMLKGMTTFV